MPFFYAMVVDNIKTDMIRRELKEIADYVSNTLANLYFLVNSTDYFNVQLTKELIYMPSSVENVQFIVKIEGEGGTASNVVAYLKDRPSVLAEAWVAPGLKMSSKNFVESGRGLVIAGCNRTYDGVFVWVDYRY
ncbi:MAG: hypothetical protein QXD45_03995 [Candidatus Bathyarchaeia archaeon]